MKVLYSTLALLLIAAPAYAEGLAVDKAGGGFKLADPAGREISLEGLLKAEGTKAVIVQIASTTCPFSQRADREFVPLARNLAEKGVKAVALFPNVHEEQDAIVVYATKVKLPYAYASDPGGKVAKAYGASVTPTFYLFDKGGVLRFRGSLTDLTAAVDAVLAGETVKRKDTPAVGCSIKWKKGTFVAPPQEGGSPDGRPAPAQLSVTAQKWLTSLLKTLESEDEAVARSATAGIAALGRGAIPHLERAQKGAEGVKAERIAKAIQDIRRPRRINSGVGRRGAGSNAPRQSMSMLDVQLLALENMLEPSEEQMKKIRIGFIDLRKQEKELRNQYMKNDREGVRKKARKLREDSARIVKEILTEEQWLRWENMRRSGGRQGRAPRTPEKKPGEGEGGGR